MGEPNPVETHVRLIPSGTGYRYIYRGYEYTINQHRTQYGYTVLKCRSCRVLITIDDHNRVLRRPPHPHPSHEVPQNVEHLNILYQSRIRALNAPQTPLRLIFNQVVNEHRATETENISYYRHRRTLQRFRSQARPNATPQTIEELSQMLESPLHRHYGQTSGTVDEARRQIYRRRVGNHSLLFISPELQANLIEENTVLAIDATFQSVPDMDAVQFLTIMARTINTMIPVAWAVMRRRNTPCYVDVFIALRQEVETLRPMSPSMIITDYEQALQRAIRTVFPNARLQGCYFHYVQSLVRNRAALGLTRPLLEQSEELRKIFAMACALPLLPAADIPLGVSILFAYADHYPQCRQLIDYIERFWEPRASIISVFEQSRRTNNEIEAYHRYLPSSMGSIHGRRPNVFAFLEGLRLLERSARQSQANIIAGIHTPYSPTAAERQHERQIMNAWTEYRNGTRTAEQLLRCMGYHAPRLAIAEANPNSDPVRIDGEPDSPNPEDDNLPVPVNVVFDWENIPPVHQRPARPPAPHLQFFARVNVPPAPHVLRPTIAIPTDAQNRGRGQIRAARRRGRRPVGGSTTRSTRPPVPPLQFFAESTSRRQVQRRRRLEKRGRPLGPAKARRSAKQALPIDITYENDSSNGSGSSTEVVVIDVNLDDSPPSRMTPSPPLPEPQPPSLLPESQPLTLPPPLPEPQSWMLLPEPEPRTPTEPQPPPPPQTMPLPPPLLEPQSWMLLPEPQPPTPTEPQPLTRPPSLLEPQSWMLLPEPEPRTPTEPQPPTPPPLLPESQPQTMPPPPPLEPQPLTPLQINPRNRPTRCLDCENGATHGLVHMELFQTSGHLTYCNNCYPRWRNERLRSQPLNRRRKLSFSTRFGNGIQCPAAACNKVCEEEINTSGMYSYCTLCDVNVPVWMFLSCGYLAYCGPCGTEWYRNALVANNSEGTGILQFSSYPSAEREYPRCPICGNLAAGFIRID